MSIGLGTAFLGLWFLSGGVFWIVFVGLGMGSRTVDDPEGAIPSPRTPRGHATTSEPTAHHALARPGL